MSCLAGMWGCFLLVSEGPDPRGSGRLAFLCIGSRSSVRDDGEDVLLADDEVLLVVELELGARVLGEEDLLARLHVHRVALALVVEGARADGDDHALLGLLLRGVGQDDAALGHLLAREGLDDDAVAERLQLRASGSGGRHGCSSFVLPRWFSTLVSRVPEAYGTVAGVSRRSPAPVNG